MMRGHIQALLLSLALFVTITTATFIFAQKASSEQTGSFTGTWIASGQRQTFDFMEGREVGTFNLAGNVGRSRGRHF